MSPVECFKKKSYQKHSEHFYEYLSGGKKEIHAKTWLKNDTVDAWRHKRMYKALDPILLLDPEAKWLTVGDGRYGNDAKYILEKGCSALASDISDSLLKEAKSTGYIPDFKKENAETLSFQNSEFEYVLCKESYHHFPRPMIALYEMLRVASKGVILIEPNDACINNNTSEMIFKKVINIARTILRKKNNRHSFEEVGNYVFTISRREIEKVALGLNYKVIAFKGINDAYLPGVEYENLSKKGRMQKKIRCHINIMNSLCRLRLIDYKILASIIFKKTPPEEMLNQLTTEGYEIIYLPENPYILSDS